MRVVAEQLGKSGGWEGVFGGDVDGWAGKTNGWR